MKRIKDKYISLILAVIMLITGAGISAFADFSVSSFGEFNSNNSMKIASPAEPETSPSASPESVSEVLQKASPSPSPEMFVELASDPTDKTDAITAGTLELTGTETYHIDNYTGANNIIIKSGANITLTITNVSITSAGAAPITVETGAFLTLNIEGENTLNAPAGCAGIYVCASDTTASYGTLTIASPSGTGKLTANGNGTNAGNAAGIGANYDSAANPLHGKIIIDSGIITANGGNVGNNGGAGIGGSRRGSKRDKCGAPIIINDGKVTAVGGKNATGIGSAYLSGCADITINGGLIDASGKTSSINTNGAIGALNTSTADNNGKVIINAGSVKSLVYTAKVTLSDAEGNKLRRVTLTMPNGTEQADLALVYNSRPIYTDADGKLYVYVPENAENIALRGTDSVFFTQISSDVSEYTLQEFVGTDICTNENGKSSLEITMADTMMVYKNAGSETKLITARFNSDPDCTYPDHSFMATYSLKDTNDNDVDASVAKIENNNLIVYYSDEKAVNNETLTLKLYASAVINGYTYTTHKDITVSYSNVSRFDLALGKIEIVSNSDPALISVKQGGTTYNIPKDTTIYIYQSSSATKTTSNIVEVKTDATVSIKDLNVKTNDADAISVGNSTNLNLILEGNNKLTSRYGAIYGKGVSTSSATISGDGSVEAHSGSKAGIGLMNLTIKSGTVYAYGGQGGENSDGCAGIGGNGDGSAIDLTIEGGHVYAYGALNAAGVGAGMNYSSSGGSFTMSGGFLYAESAGSGCGVGYGGNSNGFISSVNITGGSIKTKNATSSPSFQSQNKTGIYLVKARLADNSDLNNIQYIEEPSPVSYTLGDDDSNPIHTYTDENGYLYLYVPNGEQWLRVTKDGQTYYSMVRIAKNDSNSTVCYSDASAKITDFNIPGGSNPVCDNEAHTLKEDVPYNLLLTGIETNQVISYVGNSITPARLNFTKVDGTNTATAQVTVKGNDRNLTTYDITLTLLDQPSEPRQDRYDISKGDVYVLGGYINYGGAKYQTNDLGYVIYGESDTNVIKLDNAMTTDENTSPVLPPITFENLNIHIDKTADSVEDIPLVVNSSANITLSGNCNLSSDYGRAVILDNFYKRIGQYDENYKINLTMRGDGQASTKLNITGGDALSESDVSKSAISLDGESIFSLLNSPTTIIKGAEGSDAITGDPSNGTGKFITDAKRAMQIVQTESPAINIVNEEDAPLYQLKGNIITDDKTSLTCTYKNETYDLWDDATLYLRLPNAPAEDDYKYVINIKYNGKEYEGITTFKDADQEVDFYTVTVTDVVYDSSIVPAAGKDITFTVSGTLLDGNVDIILIPKDSTKETLTETVTKDSKNICKAVLSIPANDSYESTVVYDAYYKIKDAQDKVPLPKPITVNRNNTVRRMKEFSIEGQIGDSRLTDNEEEDYHQWTIYMPYDEDFSTTRNFTANHIVTEPENLPVDPTENESTAFTPNGNYMVKRYRLFTRDYALYTDYFVRLYREPTPQITSLSFRNPLTADGDIPTGDVIPVTVTARGRSTNYMKNAKNEENRKVYLCLDIDGTEYSFPTVEKYENGVAIYEGVVNVPKNTSDEHDAQYTVSAKIGSTKQAVTNTIIVPRMYKSLTGITRVTVDKQMEEQAVFDDDTNTFTVTMPYDAVISSIRPIVYLEDNNASYVPTDEQDFSATNPITYTVTSENRVTTEDYYFKINMQPSPVVSELQFTNPKYSTAGHIVVNIKGTNLKNVNDAINHSKDIRISATLTSGDSQDSNVQTAVALPTNNEDEDYIATLVVPPNNGSVPRTYNINVIVGDIDLTPQTYTLTIPAKEDKARYISSVFLINGQSQLSDTLVSTDENGNETHNLEIYVPYNTKYDHIKPVIDYAGRDFECLTSNDEYLDFSDESNPVTYRVTAEDDKYNDYRIIVHRGGTPKITSVKLVNKPKIFSDTTVTANILGHFVPNLDTDRDVVTAKAVYRDSDEIVYDATISYNTEKYGEYEMGGYATAVFNFDSNNADTDKIYDVNFYVNGVLQPSASAVITIPHKKSRKITFFSVNGQIPNSTVINDVDDKSAEETENTITFKMPYETDLTALTPTIRIDGDDYSPKGAQDFEGKTNTYTVTAEGDTPRSYKATVSRDGLPSISNIKISNTPKTFIGSDVQVDVEGIFFYNMKIKAIPRNGEEAIDGVVTMNGWHKASAVIPIPRNDSQSPLVYDLEIYLDNFTTPITYSTLQTITVPRRTTRAITNFTISNMHGVADIQENDIYVEVEYPTDISDLYATTSKDGDTVTPADGSSLNFDNPTKSVDLYVGAEDDVDRKYTVHLSRYGKPEIKKLVFANPGNFRGGSVAILMEGIFFESAEISAVLEGDGQEIPASVNFQEGKVSAIVDIPTNYSTTKNQIWRLKFKVDGFDISYVGGTEITVPKRTTRKLTSFEIDEFKEMPGYKTEIVESETDPQKGDIYVDVPYHMDLTNITPSITYEADNIVPSANEAQDFSDLKKPVTYTLTSSGDTGSDARIYTVHITRVGHDPYLNTITVPELQTKDTEYDAEQNLYSIQLKSNANLKEITPALDLDEDVVGYTPESPVDFSNSKKEPVVYTIWNVYGIQRTFNVAITKKSSGGGGGGGGGSQSTPKPTASPEPTSSPTPEPTAAPTPTPKATNAPVTSHTPEPTEEPSKSHEPYINGYVEDDMLLFKPNETIKRAEVAKILSVLDEEFDPNAEYSNSFSDILESAWYAKYMNYASMKGYISGYEDGTSRPENMITRAEFVSMLSRFAKIEPIETDDKFVDISEVEWCRKQINTFAEMGIVSGYEGGLFMPNNNVTRAEVVTMINKLLGRQITDEILNNIINPFADVSKDHWAYGNIMTASCEY